MKATNKLMIDPNIVTAFEPPPTELPVPLDAGVPVVVSVPSCGFRGTVPDSSTTTRISAYKMLGLALVAIKAY